MRKALERWKGPVTDMQGVLNDETRKDEHHLYRSLTKQSLKAETDIKNIIRKARKGILTHVNEYEARFGDATAMDFQEALNLVNSTNEWFAQLPVDIRNHFENDPMAAIDLLDKVALKDPTALAQAEKLGFYKPPLDRTGDAEPALEPSPAPAPPPTST